MCVRHVPDKMLIIKYISKPNNIGKLNGLKKMIVYEFARALE